MEAMSCEANLEQELDDVCQLAHDSYLPDLSAEFWDNFEDFTETEQSPHGSITSYWTKKKPWSENEDRQLLELVNEYGPTGHWMLIAELLLTRNGKQCRERYKNHLSPEVNKDDWTQEEDELIQQLYLQYGSKWVQYRKHLPGRTDHAIKNRWHRMKRNERPRPVQAVAKRSTSQSSVSTCFDESQATNSVVNVVESSNSSESSCSYDATPRNLSMSTLGSHSLDHLLVAEHMHSPPYFSEELQYPNIASTVFAPQPPPPPPPSQQTYQPLQTGMTQSTNIPAPRPMVPSLQIVLPVDEYLDMDIYQRTPASLMSSELPTSYSPQYRSVTRTCSAAFDQEATPFYQQKKHYCTQAFSPSMPLLIPEARQMEGLSPCLVYPTMMYFAPPPPPEYSPAVTPQSMVSSLEGYYTVPESSAPTPMPPLKRNKSSKKKGKDLDPPQMWKGSYFAHNDDEGPSRS